MPSLVLIGPAVRRAIAIRLLTHRQTYRLLLCRLRKKTSKVQLATCKSEEKPVIKLRRLTQLLQASLAKNSLPTSSRDHQNVGTVKQLSLTGLRRRQENEPNKGVERIQPRRRILRRPTDERLLRPAGLSRYRRS